MRAESILEKVKKLLNLANSPNENEARAAAAKANELLLKHNLSLQQVEDLQFDYETQLAENCGHAIQYHQKSISVLLQKFFFVKVIYSRGFEDGKRNRKISFVGTKENCTIAIYIFAYLSRAYPQLWQKYRAETDCPITDKKPYFAGLTQGILKMLEETKWRVEQETGLVLKEDPKLKEFFATLGTRKSKPTPLLFGDTSKTAFDQGVNDGKNITLRKPVESETKESRVLSLT